MHRNGICACTVSNIFYYQNEHIPCIDSNEASLYIECKAKM